MTAYLIDQTQQMERATTFAEIRRIEERVSRMAQVRPEVRRRAAWPFSALAARRRRAAAPCDAAVSTCGPCRGRGIPSRPGKGPS
jgi:hypothetical protein